MKLVKVMSYAHTTDSVRQMRATARTAAIMIGFFPKFERFLLSQRISDASLIFTHVSSCQQENRQLFQQSGKSFKQFTRFKLQR